MTGSKILVSILMTMLLGLGACARPALAGPQAEAARAGGLDVGSYKLGVGDKVRVLVFNEQTLSGEFQVSAAGTVAMPLIGEIPAINKTATEVAAQIQAKLADGYLRDPKVSMEVVTYRPYFILGEVKTPGQYPFSIDLTVTNAIATAAGYTPRADKKTVFIRRSGDALEKPYRLTADLRVYPGDTIRLGERFF